MAMLRTLGKMSVAFLFAVQPAQAQEKEQVSTALLPVTHECVLRSIKGILGPHTNFVFQGPKLYLGQTHSNQNNKEASVYVDGGQVRIFSYTENGAQVYIQKQPDPTFPNEMGVLQYYNPARPDAQLSRMIRMLHADLRSCGLVS